MNDTTLFKTPNPKNETLKKYIKEHCLLKTSKGDNIFNKAGERYSWLFDLRPLSLNPVMLNAFSTLFWDKMHARLPFQLAAVELAGVPLMSALLHEAGKRGVDVTGLIVRTKRKKYGTQKLVEGTTNNYPVVVIDDSCNTASSLSKAVVSLRNEGLFVTDVFTIIDFHSQKGVEWMFSNKIKLHSLFSVDEFNVKFSNPHHPNQSYDIVWTFASPSPNYGFAVAKSTPVIHNDNIIFGSDCGILWCLDVNTGRIKWTVQTQDKTGKGIISSPALHNGCVYFGAYDGILYCVNADTGAVVRARKMCDWIGSSPLIVGNKLYIGLEFRASPQGKVACIDLATFNIVWEYGVVHMLHGSAIYSDKHNAIIIGTNDGEVLVFSHDSGKLLQKIITNGPVKYHCAVKDDVVVFGSFDGNIYVYNFITGEKLFSYLTDDIVYSRPLIIDDKAFMGSADGQFVVIDLTTNTLIDSFDCGEKIHSSPAYIDGLVYFGTSAGELIGIDPVNLNTIVRLQFPERLTNTLVKYNNMLYVYAYDNKMWAIKI